MKGPTDAMKGPATTSTAPPDKEPSAAKFWIGRAYCMAVLWVDEEFVPDRPRDQLYQFGKSCVCLKLLV